jgi:hypothetical protein
VNFYSATPATSFCPTPLLQLRPRPCRCVHAFTLTPIYFIINSKMKLSFRNLRKFNLAAGLFTLTTGITILVITDKDATLPWYTNFPEALDTEDTGFYVPEPERVAQIPIGFIAGIFLLLSAADHLIVCLPFFNRIYNRDLCANKNAFRWAEYSVSASLMHVMVAQLSGITDIHLLFAIFGLSATTMAHGWLMERENGEALTTFRADGDAREVPQPKNGQFLITTSDGEDAMQPRSVSFTPFFLGCVPHLFAWSIILCYFFVNATRGSPPGFVWAIIVVEFSLDALFAVNQWLQFRQVKGWRGFAKGEFWYIVLSLTAKQLLAWIK